jgi:hypothetical protein
MTYHGVRLYWTEIITLFDFVEPCVNVTGTLPLTPGGIVTAT